MKLADIPDGQAVFVDANRFVYATDFNSPIYSICRQRARTAGIQVFDFQVPLECGNEVCPIREILRRRNLGKAARLLERIRSRSLRRCHLKRPFWHSPRRRTPGSDTRATAPWRQEPPPPYPIFRAIRTTQQKLELGTLPRRSQEDRPHDLRQAGGSQRFVPRGPQEVSCRRGKRTIVSLPPAVTRHVP